MIANLLIFSLSLKDCNINDELVNNGFAYYINSPIVNNNNNNNSILNLNESNSNNQIFNELTI